MAKDFDPQRLDIQRFAEAGAELRGSDALAAFPRLARETEGEAQGDVQWHARGELRNPRHVQPQVWVHLEAGAGVPLLCQRCLTPVEVPLVVSRSFRFVADEATAAAEDDDAEEDLLALSHSFDLKELVEDELLMEVPVAPMHDACPVAVKMSVTDPGFEAAEAEREHPFAVLGKFKASR